MFSTYKAMTTSLSSDLKKKTAEELCFQYAQAKTNAEKHRIIRTMFVKLFPMRVLFILEEIVMLVITIILIMKYV